MLTWSYIFAEYHLVSIDKLVAYYDTWFTVWICKAYVRATVEKIFGRLKIFSTNLLFENC
jgi:hypothetical protein